MQENMDPFARARLARAFAHSIGLRGAFMAGDAETLRLIVIDLAGELERLEEDTCTRSSGATPFPFPRPITPSFQSSRVL